MVGGERPPTGVERPPTGVTDQDQKDKGNELHESITMP